jgi:Rieske 2Fe-2S family protein
MTESSMNERLARRRIGFGLSREFYVSDEVFQREMDAVFYRRWLFAGFTCQAPSPGDYFRFDAGEHSLLIMRGDDGALRALSNSCRHRGSRLRSDERGHCGKLVCPYHAWVYERDGRLARARWMGDDFNGDDYSLRSAHLEVVDGLVYVCLADEPPDFRLARETIGAFIRPHGLDRAKLCFQRDYTINANWKLILENNRECYHCPGGHPEFCKVNFDVGMPGDPRSDAVYREKFSRMKSQWEALGLKVGPVNFPDGEWFRCARVPLRDGCVTESMDGLPVAPVMGELASHDLGSLRVINLPNAWFHFNSDNCNGTQLWPLNPRQTRARLTWFVAADAVENVDYDPQDVAAFWRTTTEQDWLLCAEADAGIRSRWYLPGPLSPIAEAGVEQWIQWYLRHFQAA